MSAGRTAGAVLALSLVLWAAPDRAKAFQAAETERGSLADHRIEWPSGAEWRDTLLLRSYNTRVVVIGTMLLGCAAGMTGSFALLRRRALMGDALSHATLPGIAMAYILATVLGANGKSTLTLLAGAVVSGLAGVAAILIIRRFTRLREDAAMGIVLSCFFGAGVALLGIVQSMPGGSAAGLESFILGKTASMVLRDAWMIAIAGAASICLCFILFKELRLLCFDDGFAASRGYSVVALDFILMAQIILVTIVGLQAVGLILMIALLVIPPSAARFWSDSTWNLFLLSGVLGGLAGYGGAVTSAVFANLPSGAMIVLACTFLFGISLLIGPRRGLLPRTLRHLGVERSVDRQHLLRAVYEVVESSGSAAARESRDGAADAMAGEELTGLPVPVLRLLEMRSWSRGRLNRAIRRAVRQGYLEWGKHSVRLTRRGHEEARRLTRQHRLWELYLIRYAEVAASRVDRDADAIEHVLEPAVIDELESMLDRDAMPASPHVLEPASARKARATSGGIHAR